MGGAVLIRALQLQHPLASAVALDPLMSERRSGNVTAQTFQVLALIDTAAHRRVQTKACPEILWFKSSMNQT